MIKLFGWFKQLFITLFKKMFELFEWFKQLFKQLFKKLFKLFEWFKKLFKLFEWFEKLFKQLSKPLKNVLKPDPPQPPTCSLHPPTCPILFADLAFSSRAYVKDRGAGNAQCKSWYVATVGETSGRFQHQPPTCPIVWNTPRPPAQFYLLIWRFLHVLTLKIEAPVMLSVSRGTLL